MLTKTADAVDELVIAMSDPAGNVRSRYLHAAAGMDPGEARDVLPEI